MNIGSMVSPRQQALRKWLSELLVGRYPKHEPLVERVAASLVTLKDLEDFSRLVVDTYEAGYLRCMNDYKDKLSAMGVKVSLSPNMFRN